MSTENNVKVVKNFFAAIGRGDKQPFEDHWVFDITIRDGRLATIREYIDTQAMVWAARMDASGPA